MKRRPLMVLPEFLERAAALSKNGKVKLLKCMNLLSRDLGHPGLQCKKVKGAKLSIYECRVDNNIRLIYDMVGGVLRCWYVGKHDEAINFGMRVCEEVWLEEVGVGVVRRVPTEVLEEALGVGLVEGLSVGTTVPVRGEKRVETKFITVDMTAFSRSIM